MASWTTVYAGFDADEETVNFGTRAFAETNGSIYESFTVAAIQPDREVVYKHFSLLCTLIDIII